MLKSGTLKFCGYFTLFIAAALVVMVFLVPYLILKKIMGGLQETYQLGSGNTKIWAQMPGGREITYNKMIQLFNLSSTTYYQIDKIKLIPAYNLTIGKSTNFTNLKFSETTVEADMVQTYYTPQEYIDQGVLDKPLLQFRHGAFRAISEIEKRPPT